MVKILNKFPSNHKLKALIFFIISLSFTGCNYDYVQILKTQSTGLLAKKEGWVFENDSVKINYNFNSRGGVVAFKLYNKLNRPIYLDWKNSSFIYNGEKNNYWIEETNTVGSSIESTKVGKNSYNAYDRNVYGLTIGLLSQKSVKAERITFIPPNSGISSNISYYQFRLTNSDRHFRIDPTKATKLMVKNLSSRKDKQIRGYFHTYNDLNSIITFRNYLAITFSENSNQFTFIDNKFYVSSLEEVDKRCLNELPKEGTVFYIDGIQEYESAHSRDRTK